MLQNIRETMSGPVAWFIVGLITLPFAFWGVDQFATGGADPTVVKVGEDKITQTEFERAYQQRYQQLATLMGDSFRPELIDTERFSASVLEDLVDEALMRQFVRDAGYRVSDAQLFDFIRKVPAFQEDGRFSTDAYRRALAMQGLTPALWEQRVREALAIEQLRRGVLDSAVLSEQEALIVARLAAQQRHLALVRLPASRFTDEVTITEEDLAAWYAQHKSRFRAPERIRIAYVELDAEKLPPAEEPPEEVLRQIYEAERDTRFTTPEERLARHVLVRFGSDREAARERAEALRRQIVEQGKPFAEVAREHSEDPGSAKDGGSLGWVRRGQMVEAFERVLFALEPGEVSEPVETEFGWHIIKLEDVRPPQVRPFEDPAVRAELLARFREREAQQRFDELADRIEQIAFESPDSLEPVAKATGLPVQTTDWFGRDGGQGIAAEEAVREAAFSAPVLSGENSRPIVLDPSRIVVLRKLEYEPERERSLEEVRVEVRAQLLRERAAQRAREAAQALLAEVESGKSLAEAAAAAGLEVETIGLVRRDVTKVDRAILDALFRLPRPQDGKPRFAMVELPDGGAAVIALTAVQTPPDADKEAATVGQRRREAVAGAELEAYRGHIREQIEVELIRAAQMRDERG